jgi:hypothetical protein
MLGFCVVEVKLFGPVQLYVAAVIVFVVRVKVVPEQTGLLDPGTGVVGGGLMVTVVVLFGPVHPATVTLTEYVPASLEITLFTVAVWVDAVNPFGPVHE